MKKSLLIIAVLTCSLNSANAQFNLKKKLEKKANEVVDKALEDKPGATQTPTTKEQKPPGGNKNGYSRDGMNSGFKLAEVLFDDPFIIKNGHLNVKGDDANNIAVVKAAIVESDKVIADYEVKITEFLNTNPQAVVLKNSRQKAISKSLGGIYAIEKLEKEAKESRVISGVYYLQDLYIYQGFMKGALRVFPDASEISERLEKINAAIAKYGSRESFMAKMADNQKQFVKNLKLTPAAQSNPKIEQMVKKQFESVTPGVTVTKVNITYGAWDIEKNDLGVPLNRKMNVSIAVKTADGKCGLANAMVGGEYSGGGNYNETNMFMPSPVTEVPCENLK